MQRLLLCITLLAFLALPACRKPHVCSGLVPELGSNNSSKSLHKHRKQAGSMPERESTRNRKHQMKRTQKNSSAGTYGRQKHFLFFGKRKKYT